MKSLITVGIEPTEGVYEANGVHLLLTLKNCATDVLDDEDKLRELIRTAAEATGATILQVTSHRFSPQGVTAVAVLAESHASLHTYPEAKAVFWDCFTCGDTCDPALSVDVLVKALQPSAVATQFILRDLDFDTPPREALP